MPELTDRAPALFELAHQYASLRDFKKAISLLRQCISYHEGFDPEVGTAFEVKTDSEYQALIEQVHRDFPPVHRATLA